MCITLVPRLRSLRCDLYIPGRFHEAESLFNLVLKVLPLEWRHGEKAVLGVASQKHIWEPWGESRKEWLYRTARQGGHSGPAPFMCVSWFWSPFPWCSGPAHSGLGELTSDRGPPSPWLSWLLSVEAGHRPGGAGVVFGC